MANYIAIDGGTTNTRVYLVTNGRILRSEKINIGAKKSIGGNTELKNAIGCAIAELLKAHSEYSKKDFFVTLEPHLQTFSGLNALVGKGFDNPYKYDTPELAFTDAVGKIKAILNK